MSIARRTPPATLAALLLAAPALAQSLPLAPPQPLVWSTVRVSDGAFEVAFPGEPTITSAAGSDLSGGFRGRLYQYVTPDRRATLMAQFNDLPTGRFIIEPDAFSAVAAMGAEAVGGTLTAVDSTPVDGHFCRSFSGVVGDSVVFDGMFRLRGNRAYTLVAVRTREFDPEFASHFLGSFAITEPRATSWIDVDLLERGYEVRLPSTPTYSEDTAFYGRAIRSAADARDNNTGQTFSSAVYTFSEYYSARNLDSHMLQFLPVGRDGVAILHDSAFTLGGYPAHDVIVGVGSLEQPERIRLVARGRRLYEVLTFTSDTSRRHNDEEFFESLRLVGDDVVDDLRTPRTQQLIADLRSDDSVRRERAVAALTWYRPEEGELPALIDALTVRYDDETYFLGTAAQLLGAIDRAGVSEAHERIIERYSQLGPRVKARVLQRLITERSESSIERFIDLVTTNPVEEGVWDWFSFWPIGKERKDLYRILIPRLYTLLDSAAAQNSLMWLTVSALDVGAIDVDDLGDDRARLLRVAAVARTGTEELRTTAVELLRRFDDDADVVSLLESYAADSVLDAAALAVGRLIELDAAVAPESLRRLAASPRHRVELYRACLDADRTELFPTDLLSQDRFAEGLAYGALDDEEEPVDSLELVESRIVTISGARGRAYLYRVRSAEDHWLTSILVGMQPESSAEVATKADIVTFGDDAFDDFTVDQHFAKLIEQAERERMEYVNAGGDEESE